jgi:hypothetical protein
MEGSNVAIEPYRANTGIQLGQTALEGTDFIPPRVKIVQAMSAEANAEDDPAKVGDLVNTLTGENYGGKLRFIPLLPFKQRVFLVREERRPAIEAAFGEPAPEGASGLSCRSLDMVTGRGWPGVDCAECPLSRWGANNEPPLCSETYNIAAMTDLGDLVFLSFAKSSAKVGKRMFSMLRLRHDKPWARVHEITTRKMSNAKGTFAVPDVKATAEVTPPELLRVAEEWMRQLAGVEIDVTTSAVQEAEVEDGETAPF